MLIVSQWRLDAGIAISLPMVEICGPVASSNDHHSPEGRAPQLAACLSTPHPFCSYA